MDKICINCALQSLEHIPESPLHFSETRYNKIELTPYADKSRDYYCPNCGLRHHFVVFPEVEIK